MKMPCKRCLEEQPDGEPVPYLWAGSCCVNREDTDPWRASLIVMVLVNNGLQSLPHGLTIVTKPTRSQQQQEPQCLQASKAHQHQERRVFQLAQVKPKLCVAC